MASHAIMPSSLAKALMAAGVQHFDLGAELARDVLDDGRDHAAG